MSNIWKTDWKLWWQKGRETVNEPHKLFGIKLQLANLHADIITPEHIKQAQQVILANLYHNLSKKILGMVTTAHHPHLEPFIGAVASFKDDLGKALALSPYAINPLAGIPLQSTAPMSTKTVHEPIDQWEQKLGDSVFKCSPCSCCMDEWSGRIRDSEERTRANSPTH